MMGGGMTKSFPASLYAIPLLAILLLQVAYALHFRAALEGGIDLTSSFTKAAWRSSAAA